MKARYLILPLFSAHALVGTAQGADIDAGSQLHAKHCGQCHATDVYSRTNRKVRSYQSLLTQVGRCDQALGLKWFDDDIANVAAYLNANYYKFPTQ